MSNIVYRKISGPHLGLTESKIPVLQTSCGNGIAVPIVELVGPETTGFMEDDCRMNVDLSRGRLVLHCIYKEERT